MANLVHKKECYIFQKRNAVYGSSVLLTTLLRSESLIGSIVSTLLRNFRFFTCKYGLGKMQRSSYLCDFKLTLVN